MSLKAFHVAFIVLAVVLAGWLAVWAWGERGEGVGYLVTAVGAVAIAVALVVYLVQFVKKMRDVSYL